MSTTNEIEKTSEEVDTIKFKATSSLPICHLSNFYGGSEFTFMSLRTKNENLKNLYLKLRDMSMDYEEFKRYRIRLQPSTKSQYSKSTYKDPYYKSSEFARGLIAKLVSKCWSNKKRLVMVNKIAKELGYEDNIKQEDFIDGTIKEKEEWMKIALRLKFENPELKKLLLETGTKKLHESPGKDSNSLWTYNTKTKEGGNLLGKCLEIIRSELQSNASSKRKIEEEKKPNSSQPGTKRLKKRNQEIDEK